MSMRWTLPLLVALAACSAPEEPKAPAFAEVDPCSLLASGDAGQMNGSPTRSERACDYPFDSLTVRLTLLTAKYADESQKLLADGGYGGVIDDRPLTRRCVDSSGEVTCDAVVEVRDGQLIGLKVLQRNHDLNLVGQVTQGLAATALERLPK
ncbi:hypothetical protein SAMN04488074_103305 [Lentzea albidocapillata subsp. violacea]|uniref:DUF3558 domain-containing protein n=1 Tax=Lentzea albidocapillata subsp. violacea TaxID=128104 RepID=A0A1G8WVV4_9PSEU|nr:hypothetical protein [Lentzea albidocapillata]SDJ82313.1 hypothetical protein SAMN04488074_103305 [Lentzea albidocapillata subsp. violacea]